MRKTFIVGKLSREAAEIRLLGPSARPMAFRAVQALVTKSRGLRV